MKLQKCFEFTGKELFFQGHFPETPILPGVMQLEFAHKAAEEMMGCSLVLSAVKKMKFMKVVTPEDRITVEVEKLDRAEALEISYRILKEDDLCSSGVLVC